MKYSCLILFLLALLVSSWSYSPISQISPAQNIKLLSPPPSLPPHIKNLKIPPPPNIEPLEIQINPIPRPLNIGGFYPYVIWINGERAKLKPGEIAALAKALNLPLDSPPENAEIHSGAGWMHPFEIRNRTIKIDDLQTASKFSF
jgi:hypothetical protein